MVITKLHTLTQQQNNGAMFLQIWIYIQVFFAPMHKYERERGADRQADANIYVALKTPKTNRKMGQKCQLGQQENNLRAKETVFWGPVKIVTYDFHNLCMQKTNLIIFPTEWVVPML